MNIAEEEYEAALKRIDEPVPLVSEDTAYMQIKSFPFQPMIKLSSTADIL